MKRLRTLIVWLAVRFGAAGFMRLAANRYRIKKRQSGELEFPFIKPRRQASSQILVYHRVNDEKDSFFPAIPTQVFAAQMEYVAENYWVCSLSEMVQRLQSRDMPDNALAITFDDGYRDNYLNAFPVLKALSLPATIFLATGAIGTGKVLWHDRVLSGFRETHAVVVEGFNDNGRITLTSLSEKLAAQKTVLEFLWCKPDDEREFWIDRLLEGLRVPDRIEQAGLMLSWDEVKAMHECGIEFGSHTASHPILSKLSEGKLREELESPKNTIEQKLGTQVTTFAYPVGRRQDFNAVTKSFLGNAGYNCAVTTIFGCNEIDQDRFELRRIMPWAEDIATFGLRLGYYKLSS